MRNLFLVLLLSITTLFFSCKKNGCVDRDAENYCKDCKDAGGCVYKSSLVFWYDESTAKKLLAEGITGDLRYFIDQNLAGSAASNVYWTSPPNCGQDQAVTAVLEGRVAYHNLTITIIDKNDQIVWYLINVWGKQNQCLQFQLTK